MRKKRIEKACGRLSFELKFGWNLTRSPGHRMLQLPTGWNSMQCPIFLSTIFSSLQKWSDIASFLVKKASWDLVSPFSCYSFFLFCYFQESGSIPPQSCTLPPLLPLQLLGLQHLFMLGEPVAWGSSLLQSWVQRLVFLALVEFPEVSFLSWVNDSEDTDTGFADLY